MIVEAKLRDKRVKLWLGLSCLCMPLGNVKVQVRERTNEQENHKARWIDTGNMDGTGLELRSFIAGAGGGRLGIRISWSGYRVGLGLVLVRVVR